jgi:hypothetical protein
MITSFPNYEDILDKLIADIETKTGITTRYNIDNQNITGDTPTNQIEFAGTQSFRASPNKVVLSHTVLFRLKMVATAANSNNIAAIIKAEGQESEVFPFAMELRTAEKKQYELSGVTGYNVNYYAQWSSNVPEMRDDKYERKWDLIVNITRR